jgi:deoxyribodipyrimidine photo-lyase
VNVAVVWLTRDLRVHDHPALAAACRIAERVVPLFVLDEAQLSRSANRSAFLVDCLHDLDGSLRSLGGGLVVRAGRDPVSEVVRLVDEVGASAVFLAADATSRAHRREEELLGSGRRLDVRVFDCHTVVGPGIAVPPGKSHYRVFSPYHRAWAATPWRSLEDPPTRVLLPAGVSRGPLPPRTAVPPAGWAGGEGEARRRAEGWFETGLPRYGELRNVVSVQATSKLSPYLRFGCLPPLELALRAGPGEFQRQLCWRDFYFQLLHANPWSETRDLMPLPSGWDEDEDALAAWREGRTGYPLVDAGMRQLAAEGWMHNRARMVAASFLTKHLNLDWRHGARHFDRLLLDGDPANNVGGWQWSAGTGADTRRGRMFNPTLQAARFDPAGDYVRRYVPELAHLPLPFVHEPRRLAGTLEAPGYPEPIVDHAEAAAAYRQRSTRARRGDPDGGLP